MSLINQMLRDLEERRAAAREPYDLQRDIRPLPPPAGRPRWPLAIGGAVLLGLGAWAATHSLFPAATPAPPAPPPAVTQTPSVPALPIAAALPPVTAEEGDSQALRLSLGLKDVPPEPPAPAAPANPASVPAPAASPSPVPAAPPAQTAGTVALPAPPKEVPAPAKPVAAEGSIEKTVVPASPRERAEMEFRRAQAAQAAGRPDEAGEALNAALRHDPTHVPARQALIRAHLEGRRGEAAESALREGLDVVPGQIGWAMSLARLQVERNDMATAHATLTRHAAQGARSADYLGFLGHVQHRLGQYRDATASYQGALRLTPGEGRWWLGLGLAQEADGQVGEARESFRRALAAGNLSPELVAVAEHRLR